MHMPLPDGVPDRMKVKVCLIGEAAVGKTCLIRRFVLDTYDDAYAQTLGTKIYKREMTVTARGETFAVDAIIWDIMGQQGFRQLLKEAYFYGAHGVLAVADLTRRETFPDLGGWIDGVRQVAGDVPIVLLANKADLWDRALIKESDVAGAAERYGAPHFATSAKTGENVARAFRELADRIAAARLRGR